MESLPAPRRSIRVRLADLPGSLHQLTRLVAAQGANIVRLEVVSHEAPDVWDDIEMTAATERQLEAVVDSLQSRGLTVIGLPAAWAIRDWATDVLQSLEEIGRAEDETEAVRRFTATAAGLANVEHAFVLMDTRHSDASAAEARWAMIAGAANTFDPDRVVWYGDSVGNRIAASAMKAARNEGEPDGEGVASVGAIVSIPAAGRRPAHLVVIGRRPGFLGPELARLEMFAQVGAPHLVVPRLKVSA